MVNPKIYATGNENIRGDFNISYYIVEKDDNFLDWLEDLLKQVLKIEGRKPSAKFVYKSKEDSEGNIIGEEIYAKDIKKMIDLHEHYDNKLDRIDLFYGKDRVYVTFRKSRESRKRFARFMEKTKEWIVIKEIPKMPLYVNKIREDGVNE